MQQGVGVASLNMPSTTQITASQYRIGQQLAQATLDYIAENLDSKAKLVHYDVEFVLPDREAGWQGIVPESRSLIAAPTGSGKSIANK